MNEPTKERQPDPGQVWKCGDEFLPFHPQASHVPPEYRDGWNRCYWMAIARGVRAWRVSTAKAGKGRAVVRHWIVGPGGERAGHFPTAEAAHAECAKRNAGVQTSEHQGKEG